MPPGANKIAVNNNNNNNVYYIIKNGGLLHNNISRNGYKEQIDTNVSQFVYCEKMFRYVFRLSRSHHQA
jgi:hypothetical protein